MYFYRLPLRIAGIIAFAVIPMLFNGRSVCFMLRTMVFIDYQNFNISKKGYLDSINIKPFNVNFSTLSENLTEAIKLNSQLIKTYLFAYKPCDQLMELYEYNSFYKWLCSIKNKNYIEVIEGSQEIRSINKDVAIDINNPKTYTTKEKGTDINLATQMLSKGYQNAYDIAILVSGDTDYLPVVKCLHDIGKIVILATLKNQDSSRKKYQEFRDADIFIDVDFLQKSSGKKDLI